jgi:hypothetical protein
MDSRTGSAATDARYVDAYSYGGLEQAKAPPAARLHSRKMALTGLP